jgi:hypothetical protein
MQKNGRIIIVSILVLLALVGIAGASIPFTTQDAKDNLPGSPQGTVKCEDVIGFVWDGQVYTVEDVQLSFDDGEQLISVAGHNFWIDAKTDPAMGQYINWRADFGPELLIVKGGTLANIYNYKDYADDTPGVADTFADGGLHAPVNPHNNQWYGISHIDMCDYYEAPEFPTVALPLGILIGFLGIVTILQKRNEL